MTTVESERWTSKHRWTSAAGFVFTSMPPQAKWRCSRCGLEVIAARPPASECPGLRA